MERSVLVGGDSIVILGVVTDRKASLTMCSPKTRKPSLRRLGKWSIKKEELVKWLRGRGNGGRRGEESLSRGD